MVCDVFELQDPDDSWLIIVKKRTGDTVHGFSTTHTVLARTGDKPTAQLLVSALRKEFNLG